MSDSNPHTPTQFPAGKGPLRLRIRRRIRVWLIAIGWCYAASLLLPAIYFPGDPAPGYICLILFPFVLGFPPWYANLFLLAGVLEIIFGVRPDEAFVLGCLATVAASLMLLVLPILGIGYYLWLASMVMLVLASRDRIALSRLEEYAEA